MPSIFAHVAVLEAVDAATLDELLASGVQPYVVRRLGSTAVVVDHLRLADLRRLLKHLGQTPRITTE